MTSQFTMTKIDPTYESTNSGKAFYQAIDQKAKDILKNDPYFQYREAVKKGIKEGLIRPKTTEEIHSDLKNKRWLKINREIKRKEEEEYE
jgi:hypothetical protein